MSPRPPPSPVAPPHVPEALPAGAAPLVWLAQDDAAPATCRISVGTIALLSRRGPGKRKNEDGILVQPLADGRAVLAVVDGMGGMPDGDAAARLTLEALSERLQEPGAEEDARAALVEGFERANESVLARAAGSGATLVAALVGQGRVQVVHAGDAEALLIGQRGRVKLRTIAHSPIAEALEAGVLDERAAMTHEERHIVTNAIGMRPLAIEVGPELELAQRDTLVLASDGLFDNLTLGEVVSALRAGPLAMAAERAADHALRRMLGVDGEPRLGKPDDLSLVAFRPAQDAPSRSRLRA